MRKATGYLLWALVFSLAWERVSLPLVGRAPVLLGPVVMGLGVLTTIVEGRVRRIGSVVGLAVAFVLSTFLSTLWAASPEPTLTRVGTYVQLVGLVWLVWEFARTQRDQEGLFIAYLAGMLIPLVSLLINYASGQRTEQYGFARYSALRLNADELGLMCALSLPIAWRIILSSRGWVRLLASIILLLAPIGVMLTGTRGAFVAAAVGLSIIPITLRYLSDRLFAVTSVVMVLAVVGVVQLVPSDSWARMGTIVQELGGGGNLTGRTEIWAAGWGVFLERPLLGTGAGGFNSAVSPTLGFEEGPHNTFLAVLVEQGLLGFLLFAVLLGACIERCRRLGPGEREFWIVMLLTWSVGGMSVHFQYHKLTWLLFALVAAGGAARPSASSEMSTAGAEVGDCVGSQRPWNWASDSLDMTDRAPVFHTSPFQDNDPPLAPMTAQHLRRGR